MMLIVVGGMIGLGKSSVAKLIGEELGSEVFYESVEDNPILPLFYTASEEEIQAKRYPYLLQMYFLNTRFKSIKQACINDNNVLDRSIYEDLYFAEKNKELGKISDLEINIYKDCLDNMLEELDELPKKAPDLMVYLKGSFETVLERINKRGRGFELAPELVEYYRFLWKDYDSWIAENYTASQVLTIDMDNTDIVGNPEDAKRVMELIKAKLVEIRGERKNGIEVIAKLSNELTRDDIKILEGAVIEEVVDIFEKKLGEEIGMSAEVLRFDIIKEI